MSNNKIESIFKKKIKPIFETLPSAAFVTDQKGLLQFFNSGLVQLLGEKPELDTNRWYGNATLYHKDGTPMDPNENPIALLDKDHKNKGAREVLMLERANGDQLWLKVTSSRLHTNKGEPVGAINMLIDITGKKKSKERLRQSETAFLNLFDKIPIGFHEMSSDGIVKQANQTILDMLGYSREEFVGKKIVDFFADQQVLEDIMKKLSAGERIQDREIRLLCKDSSICRVLLNSESYQKDGQLIHSQFITRDITKQRQTQVQSKNIKDKLNRKERLYEAIISSTPDPMYVFDLNYRLIFANDALLELWGLTKNEYSGNSLREIGCKELNAEMHEREIDQVVATKEPVQGEVSFPHDELGKRDYEYIFVPVLDSANKVEAIAGTARDITKRTHAEKSLRRNEKKYRTLVENFPDGAVALFDRDLNYTAVGGKFLETADINPDNRIGNSIYDLYPDKLVHEIEPYFRAALNGEAKEFEIEYNNRHLLAQTLPVRENNGEVVTGMFVVLNITERWQAQKAMRKSEEKYSSLFETMNEGFALIQMEFNAHNEPIDFRVLEINPAYQKHTGLEENVEGKKAKEVLPDLQQDIFKELGKVSLTGEPFQDEFYIEELDRWLDLSTFHFGKPEEQKVAVLFNDITERKQTQKELEKMNETLEERVEERTRSLLTYQEKLRSLVSQLSRTEEKQRQQLATELHDNLGQMLALSKIKVNKIHKGQSLEEITSTVEELKETIDEAIRYTKDLTSDLKPPPSVSKDTRASLNWLTEKIEEHGLTVIIDEDEHPKPIDDEIRSTVLQCVRELLFNIIRHTSENEAKVRLSRKGNQLKISVEDEGKGFDSKNMENSSIEEGSFGLFNIRERIDLLDGRVDIDSKKGRGTKVTLYVPLSETHSSDEEWEQAVGIDNTGTDQPAQDTSDNKTEIIIVDDHKMFRKGLRKVIEDEDDMKVVGEAGNGEEAITLSRETTPDVILMDVSMPKIDGIEATWKIKKDIPDVRVIGVSLHDSREVRQDMRDAGASAYLTKTEAFESLIETIRAEVSATNN